MWTRKWSTIYGPVQARFSEYGRAGLRQCPAAVELIMLHQWYISEG